MTYEHTSVATTSKFDLFTKFKHYSELQTGLVVKDNFLHLAVFGTNILMIRLSGNDMSKVPLLLVTFGSAVWVSTFLLKKYPASRVTEISWLILPLPFVLMYFAQTNFSVIFCAVFVRNIIYWNIYNQHSVQVQTLAPVSHVASIVAARHAIVMIIMGSGEVVMGNLAATFTLGNELIVRISLCSLLAIYVYAKK